jgi:long-chain acyl-CoA synthetase
MQYLWMQYCAHGVHRLAMHFYLVIEIQHGFASLPFGPPNLPPSHNGCKRGEGEDADGNAARKENFRRISMVTRAAALATLTQEGRFELVVDEASGWPLRVYRHAPRALRDVLIASRAFEARAVTVFGDESLTYRGHFSRVAALAAKLVAVGIAKGDRVAIGMRNYPEWSIAFWACQAIGAVMVALNAWWTAHELAYAIEDSAARVLILDGERLERLRERLQGFDLKLLVVARRGTAGDGGLEFGEAAGALAADLPEVDVGPHDLATILYTSGTTGNPKGAMATQRNHITHLMNSLLADAATRLVAGRPAELDAGGPQTATLHTYPFFHIGGLGGLYVSLATGTKLALMYRWDPVEAVHLVEEQRLTAVSGVPIVIRQLLETAADLGADVSSLVSVTSGGAPVPPDLTRRIYSQLQHRAAPGNRYGLTETTSTMITNVGDDCLARPGSIGRPVATADVRIVGEGNVDVPDGEIGEFWLRGPNVIPGYWNDPEATETAFGGGWFRTGDLGYRDPDGFYYLVDRLKDVIIRGGENVYCAEVEAALLEHPRVRDAALLGLPHPAWGEEVAAVLQVRPEDLAEAVAEQIRASLEDRLARFKVPTSVRLTESDLPRTATGKILKRELRVRYFAGSFPSDPA